MQVTTMLLLSVQKKRHFNVVVSAAVAVAVDVAVVVVAVAAAVVVTKETGLMQSKGFFNAFNFRLNDLNPSTWTSNNKANHSIHALSLRMIVNDSGKNHLDSI